MTRAQMASAEAGQRATATMMHKLGHHAVADRLLACLHARQARRGSGGRRWPYRCRLLGCRWCTRTTQHAAWFATLGHSPDGRRSLVILPLRHRSGQIMQTVKAVRRALRDVRDRQARHRWRWRTVSMKGVVVGDALYILIHHPAVQVHHLSDVLIHRWRDAQIMEVGTSAPRLTEFADEDMVSLALHACARSLHFRVRPCGHRLGPLVPPWSAPLDPMPMIL